MSKLKMKTDKPNFHCPTCGKAVMEHKSGTCTLTDGLTVPDVEWDECSVCGEMLFDPDNSDKIIDFKRPRRRLTS
ncbi:MAG: YgiT-type zinc finger protein, partial [Calditrichaeota bacterium]|nr:YgiT-type zinc finger protein [Calditrichota bacterium]